jgi:hypothetical protein
VLPARASLGWLGGTAALALALWAVTVSAAVVYAGGELELLVYIAGLMASVVTGCAVSIAGRFFLHDAMVRNQARIINEVEAIRAQMATHLDDSTTEINVALMDLIAQQAMASARLAALSEQLSAKVDSLYWHAYADGAHDVGSGAAAQILPFPARQRGGA